MPSLTAARAIACAATLFALAACGQTLPVTQQQSASSSALESSASSPLESSTSNVLFVADSLANKVWMFPAGVRHASALGAITAGISSPQALHVDSKGILYVANSSSVTEYKPGAVTPFRTLTNRGAASITVDSSGTVYVGNGCSVFPSGGSISVFSAGSTAPNRTIVLKDCSFMGGMAINSSGRLVVQFFQYPEKIAHVQSFAPGSSTGTELQLSGVAELAPGLAFDQSGNLFVNGGNGRANGINVYVPGSSLPQRTISSGLSSATGLALSSSGALFVANYPGAEGASFVTECAPGASTPINTFSGNLTAIFGIAVRPAL